MSNITNTDAVVTESKLTEFYEDIKPYLGCPAYLTSEGTSDYYSTDEKVIGRWTDGKPLYQKTISCGTLPNNTTKTVFKRILISSARLQFSKYSLSNATTSSKSVISLLPLTCQSPVIPGLKEILLF